MRVARTRAVDATFDLNLAPMLDIIVTVVPMLLLSIAFIQVRMIDTTVPQMVVQASQDLQKQKSFSLSLSFTKENGFVFETREDEKVQNWSVANKNGAVDLDGLYETAVKIKKIFPFALDLNLEPTVEASLNDMVAVMDVLRKLKSSDGKAVFTDSAGKTVETDFLFPGVVFANAVER